MTRFLLIRHATTNSVGKRLSGRMPGIHLNDAGRVQAQELAERLRGLPLRAIYSSPLERAQETAGPVAGMLGLDTVTDPDFMEMDFGDWTDCAFEALAHNPQFRQFNVFRSGMRIPGGEGMAEAQLRIVRGMEKLVSRHGDETVAVVSHADIIKSAVAYYAGIHLDLFQRLEISPASVSMIEIYPETARIMLVNHTGKISF